jgi:diaminopimelate epimerase
MIRCFPRVDAMSPVESRDAIRLRVWERGAG